MAPRAPSESSPSRQQQIGNVMSPSVYILGVGSTPVRKQPERGFTDLVTEAFTAAVEDARLDDVDRIEGTWFSNSLMDFWGQREIGRASCRERVCQYV